MQTARYIVLLGAIAQSLALLAENNVSDVAAGVRLPAGTPVVLRFASAVSSAEAHVNDRVEFRVAGDVRSGSTTVVPKDSAAWGIVTEAAPKARMARPGKLSINIEAACLADGQAAPLRAMPVKERRAEERKNESGIGDTLFTFPAWPILLFRYGQDRTISAGTEVTVYTDRDVVVDPLSIGSSHAAGVCSQAPAAVTPVANACTANIRSDPAGAEIRVDGKFVGDTPSRLLLGAGEHTVVIVSPAHRTWQRTVSAIPGSEISIAAVLPPEPAGEASRVDPAAGLSMGKN